MERINPHLLKGQKYEQLDFHSLSSPERLQRKWRAKDVGRTLTFAKWRHFPLKFRFSSLSYNFEYKRIYTCMTKPIFSKVVSQEKYVKVKISYLSDFKIFTCLTGSGVGYGGPNYHLGSREDLDVVGPNLGNYCLDRSGSDGDGEEDSPLPHHRPIPLHPHLAAQAAAAQQSLRRAQGRPPPHYQLPHTENPYQQPYLSRSGSRDRHDSLPSDNGSEGTLTDSDLPFANHQQSSAALQNGEI